MASAAHPTPPRGVRNPTFPVPIFPDAQEWWNPEDWREAAEIAASVAERPVAPTALIATGTKFWLRAMAGFPELQLVELHQVRSFWKRKSTRRIVKMVPGLGWDIFLQQFALAEPEEVGGQFAAAAREEEDPVLVGAYFECSKHSCTEYVCVCVCVCACLCVVEMLVITRIASLGPVLEFSGLVFAILQPVSHV